MAFKLKISEPFVITQGPRYKDIGWGLYQEPSLGRADDGTIYAGVKMTEDSGKAYGAKNGTSFFRRDFFFDEKFFKGFRSSVNIGFVAFFSGTNYRFALYFIKIKCIF